MDFIFLPWLFLLLLLPIFLFLVKSRKPNLPPGPPKLPIIGNLHQLGDMNHKSLANLSKKYGPVMLLNFGQAPALIVSSPEMAREVLITQDLACCSRPPAESPRQLSYNFLDVAFSPFNDYWRKMRKIFVTEILKKPKFYVGVIENEVARFVDSISQASPNPVNLSEEIFQMLEDIMCRIGCGKTYDGKQFTGGNKKHDDAINEAISMLVSFSASDFFPYFGWILDVLSGLHAKRKEVFRNFDRFYQKMIDDHLDPARPKPENEDIIDILLALSRDHSRPVGVITHDHIKAILMNVFLGGVDTSSITIVWAMSEMIRNPRIMKKVQEEIRRSVGNKPLVQETDVGKLHYLKMVIKETFRYHPPSVMLIPRQTLEHCKIGGYDVFPGTKIHINVWAMGRDPKIWENPEEFYPERFADIDTDFRGRHFELVPFGGGRRICPAINMAETMLELTLANLLHRFDWELPKGMKREEFNMEEGVNTTVHKKVPLLLVPIKYKLQE